MVFSEYTGILIDSIAHYLIILVIAGLILLPGEIIYLKSKRLNRKEKAEGWEGAHLCVLCFILVLVIVLYNVIPVVIDISNENYVSVHGEYYTVTSRYRADFYVTTDDGEQLNLRPPFGSGLIQNFDVPRGEHEGTIWYAEKSELIVDYIPDEEG